MKIAELARCLRRSTSRLHSYA